MPEDLREEDRRTAKADSVWDEKDFIKLDQIHEIRLVSNKSVQIRSDD